MILIILATSVLVLVPYEISIASPAKVAIAAVTPLISKINNKVAVDKFGIKEIYPTTPNGGREWYINMNSPLSGFSLTWIALFVSSYCIVHNKHLQNLHSILL
ncbi:MAG: hypothetical protein WAJ93_11570 [Candidatus Nitrosopolaris sp.]